MKKIDIKLKEIITRVTIFIIFAQSFIFAFSFYREFKFYHILFLFILLLLLILLRKKVFNKLLLLCSSRAFLIFFIIIYFSLLNLYLGKTTFFSLGKQIFGILLYSLVFYLLIEYNNRDIKRLFTFYLNIAFFVAIIGLVQESAFLLYYSIVIVFPGNSIPGTILPFLFKYDYLSVYGYWPLQSTDILGFHVLRVNSIMLEPYSFCTIMIPAFFVALSSFKKNNFKFLSKKKSLVIIMAFFLSFSLVGYIGIFCTIGLLLFKSRRFILCLVIPFLLAVFSYQVVGSFILRIPYVYKLLTGENKLKQTHDQSTFTWVLNSLVVYDILKSGDFLFGRGLGSHETSYNAYVEKNNIEPPKHAKWLLNREDANSLFLRLLSETGLFGLMFFLTFIVSNYINANKDPTNYLWVINNSILILFIIRLIRQGNYFSEGFFFFIWLYYFSNKLLKENIFNHRYNENTH